MIEIAEAEGVDGGVGGGFDFVALLNGGAVKRLRDGRWKLDEESNSLLILMSHGPVESGRDGGVTGGGGGLNNPSPEQPRD